MTKVSAASALVAVLLGACVITAVPAVVGWDHAPVRAEATDAGISPSGVTSPTIEVTPQPRHTEDWCTQFEGLGGRYAGDGPGGVRRRQPQEGETPIDGFLRLPVPSATACRGSDDG